MKLSDLLQQLQMPKSGFDWQFPIQNYELEFRQVDTNRIGCGSIEHKELKDVVIDKEHKIVSTIIFGQDVEIVKR